MAVRIERNSDIAIVCLDNPPVNSIGVQVRTALMAAIEALSADTKIKGVVLTGSESIFAAGADAREFEGPPAAPHLPDVVAAIERSPQPWIAAIRGSALGGGCELALACRMRIAASDARLGLPEVTLGVVPGAGGTQRLPRLVGLKAALNVIAYGTILSAGAALKIGLIDLIAEDPVAAAKMRLRDTKWCFPETLSNRPRCSPDPEAINITKDRIARRMSGQIAPVRAIELVELASVEKFRTAIEKERRTFLELRNSDQARALRHVFFAERGARGPSWIMHLTPPEVRRVLIIGGGTMGAGISYAFERAGYKVALVEVDDQSCQRATNNVQNLYRDATRRGLLSELDAQYHFQNIAFLPGFGRLPEVDLAVEAVFEDMDIKRNLFRTLDRALPSHAVLATNTSYLDVNEIAAATNRPEKVVGLHFFSPAHVMKLIEIVKGDKTAPDTLASAIQVARKLKKIPVMAGVCDGFIGNRILSRYREEADFLLMDGALPWTIDAAMVKFGMAMGPYETQDLSGLDIGYAQRKRRASTRDPNRRYIPIADRIVEKGRLGRKSGAGWYRYSDDRKPLPDPFVENLILEEARLANVGRRQISDEEIRTTLIRAMIHEATNILSEGVASTASDIDLVLVHG